MNLIKHFVTKPSPSDRWLLCEVCGKRVKGSCKLTPEKSADKKSTHGKSDIYMGPNGVVVQDFAAGKRGLCHNECVGKRRVTFQLFQCRVTYVENQH